MKMNSGKRTQGNRKTHRRKRDEERGRDIEGEKRLKKRKEPGISC